MRKHKSFFAYFNCLANSISYNIFQVLLWITLFKLVFDHKIMLADVFPLFNFSMMISYSLLMYQITKPDQSAYDKGINSGLFKRFDPPKWSHRFLATFEPNKDGSYPYDYKPHRKISIITFIFFILIWLSFFAGTIVYLLFFLHRLITDTIGDLVIWNKILWFLFLGIISLSLIMELFYIICIFSPILRDDHMYSGFFAIPKTIKNLFVPKKKDKKLIRQEELRLKIGRALYVEKVGSYFCKKSDVDKIDAIFADYPDFYYECKENEKGRLKFLVYSKEDNTVIYEAPVKNK